MSQVAYELPHPIPAFTGVAPPVQNRPCGECGHPEADAHVLNDHGRRAACGRTRVSINGQRIRCRCNAFVPPAGAR